jgi:hypothetical protein
VLSQCFTPNILYTISFIRNKSVSPGLDSISYYDQTLKAYLTASPTPHRQITQTAIQQIPWIPRDCVQTRDTVQPNKKEILEFQRISTGDKYIIYKEEINVNE